MRDSLGRAVAWAAEIWALLAGVILLAIVAVTTINVAAFSADRVARNWGGSVGALPGYEDFVRLAVSAAVLMLLPYCQLRRGHIAVDLLAGRLPASLRLGLERIWTFGIAALALALAWAMVFGMLEARADGALSRVLGWQEWPFYMPGIASLLLWALVALTQPLEARAGE
ncbi:MAG: TRAP transporter small permease subunit [Pseudomonadota bacterium]